MKKKAYHKSQMSTRDFSSQFKAQACLAAASNTGNQLLKLDESF